LCSFREHGVSVAPVSRVCAIRVLRLYRPNTGRPPSLSPLPYHAMLCGSVDRIIMLVFALVELIALIAMLSAGGSVLTCINDHASSMPVGAGTIDHEDRLRRLINGSIGCGAFALLALLAVTTYYSTSALLLWLGRRADVVRADGTSHREMKLAPTAGAEGCCRITLKLLNITVGLLGIIAITISSSLFGAARWQAEEVPWADAAHAKEAVDLIGAAMGLAILALLMKVAEAFLGHLWAVNLSNTRDYVATMRDGDLLAASERGRV